MNKRKATAIMKTANKIEKAIVLRLGKLEIRDLSDITFLRSHQSLQQGKD